MTPKPLGVFVSNPRPAWATFALLPEWEDFAAAVKDAETTGVRWVLYIGGPAHNAPLDTYLRDELVPRIEKAGLRPYLVAACYREEWYSEWQAGRLAVPDHDPANAEHWLPAARLIRSWCSIQHAAIKAALDNIPLAWIDGFVNDDASFGRQYYRPVPDHVTVLALEGYVPAVGSWAADVEPFLQHAVSTRREPIALIIQGFQTVGGDPMWSRGPTPDGIEGTKRWLAHPRVISGWLFDWGNRGTGILGLTALPQRAALEAALGVETP